MEKVTFRVQCNQHCHISAEEQHSVVLLPSATIQIQVMLRNQSPAAAAKKLLEQRLTNVCYCLPGSHWCLIVHPFYFFSGLNKYSSHITQPKSQGASQAMLYATGEQQDTLQRSIHQLCNATLPTILAGPSESADVTASQTQQQG